MPTQKRERKRAGHQARQAAAMAAARRRRARRSRTIAGAFLALVLIAGLAVVVSGGGDNSQDVASTDTSTTAVSAQSNSTAASKRPVDLPPVPAGQSIKGDTPCPPADGSAPRTTSFEKQPPLCVVVAKTYQAEMNTSKGVMVIDLDVKNATKTVNNFVVLSRYHYYDGIAFHRVIPGFVIQGGDPQETGTGGPGYTFEDEPPKAGTGYKVGSVAMAKSQQPNSNGSQFFIVTGDAGTSLPPQYSLFGQVTQGLDVMKAIEDIGIPGTQDGKPSEVVKINSITIKET